MAPSNPKRPGRPPPPARAADPKKKQKTELELPFDDAIEPLRADDPSPQRVPQFPSNGKRAVRIMREERDDEATSALAKPRPSRYRTPVEPEDTELPPSYASSDVAEPGYSPASVYVERGPGMGQLAPVKQGLVLIGRASSAGLRLQHPSISRRHSQITRRGERFFIKDLGSQNGTYVNQVKIDREAEIFPGDELVIGTSQLRLRGVGMGHTGTSTHTRGPSPSPSFFNAHVTGIAIASCAVGIGLASVIIFAFFKLGGGPSYEQAPLAQVAPTPLPAALPPPMPNRVPASVQAAADRVDEPAVPAAEPPAPARVERAPERRATAPSTPRSSPRRKAAPAPKPKPEAPAEVRIDPVILARYEKGDVAGAVALARKKGADAAAAKLARFQNTWESAQKALASQDERNALRLLDAALKQDEAIGGGWSSYNGQIRKQLSAVHLMAGARQARAGSLAGARTSLRQALRFDPQNQAAKAEMEKLQAAAAEQARANALKAASGN